MSPIATSSVEENAIPTYYCVRVRLIAEILAREISAQLLDRPMNAPLRFMPIRRSPVPPPVSVSDVLTEYLEMEGDHTAHPGTGKGK